MACFGIRQHAPLLRPTQKTDYLFLVEHFPLLRWRGLNYLPILLNLSLDMRQKIQLSAYVEISIFFSNWAPEGQKFEIQKGSSALATCKMGAPKNKNWKIKKS